MMSVPQRGKKNVKGTVAKNPKPTGKKNECCKEEFRDNQNDSQYKIQRP